MNLDIKIRKADSSDALEIVNVKELSRAQTYPLFNSSLTYKELLQTSEEKARLVKYFERINDDVNYLCLVAEVEDKIVGFILLRKKDDIGYLDQLFILNEYQGKGIGSKLMSEALPFLNDKKFVQLNVLKENSNAIRLYEKFGFKLTNDPIKDMSIEGHIIPRVLMRKLPSL